MANRYGPRIVTDGLVMCLDAADKNSYPGSGATWYDLSGNGYNGTIVGTVPHGNGVFTLPKTVGNYINVTGINLSTTNHTIMGASRYVTLGGRVFSGGANNWLMGHWSNSTMKYYANGWVTDTSGTEQSDTKWRIYAGLGNYSSDLWTFYVNGELDTGPNGGGVNGPNQFSIGRYYGSNGEYSNAQIGFLLAYNRVLQDWEIKQNYNMFRGRFGL